MVCSVGIMDISLWNAFAIEYISGSSALFLLTSIQSHLDVNARCSMLDTIHMYDFSFVSMNQLHLYRSHTERLATPRMSKHSNAQGLYWWYEWMMCCSYALFLVRVIWFMYATNSLNTLINFVYKELIFAALKNISRIKFVFQVERHSNPCVEQLIFDWRKQ